MFIETSAKAGHNVKALFRKIAQALPGMDRDSSARTGNQSQSVWGSLSVISLCSDVGVTPLFFPAQWSMLRSSRQRILGTIRAAHVDVAFVFYKHIPL
jgi:hypothetical protein